MDLVPAGIDGVSVAEIAEVPSGDLWSELLEERLDNLDRVDVFQPVDREFQRIASEVPLGGARALASFHGSSQRSGGGWPPSMMRRCGATTAGRPGWTCRRGGPSSSARGLASALSDGTSGRHGFPLLPSLSRLSTIALGSTPNLLAKVAKVSPAMEAARISSQVSSGVS